MKRLIKKISTLAICVMVAVMMVVPMTAFAANPSFGISASSSTVAPNGTFTVKIGGECIGRVDLTVSNGTLSENKIWVENGYNSVSVTAGSSGTVTVTAIPYEGMSDIDANLYEPGSRSVTVTIVEPTPEPDPDDSDKPSGGDSDKPSGGDSSKPDSSDTDKDVEEEPVVDEPVEDEPVVDEPVVDEPIEDEPVVDEPVVEEPVEKGCFIHWIILIVMVIAAILTFVFKKSMVADIAVLAVAAIISVILSAVVGHCMADWIITVIGIVVLAIMSMMFSKNAQTSAK